MEVPPAIEQCISGHQDVVVSVSGKPAQVAAFRTDAIKSYAGWTTSGIETQGDDSSLTLRGKPDTPYVAVATLQDSAKLRLMPLRINFLCDKR
ncbi:MULTISPECIES: hypothetical protein [unclassified Sphingomonas]|uniref:hypothetical protein n=1 Tax=unclassified Sphingomonas TaxID=196159 RepID=UPI0006F51798|nr:MULTISPECIES: hypothetical protein [unclassified Sphingomonas]KQM28897.1 hypothetical protein ASE58_03330 [Sphingomonas sp. Leaf9]KQM45598.1 hypothetical protein ASE57_03320 [Sphingomonas sp. Leaf11]